MPHKYNTAVVAMYSNRQKTKWIPTYLSNSTITARFVGYNVGYKTVFRSTTFTV